MKFLETVKNSMGGLGFEKKIVIEESVFTISSQRNLSDLKDKLSQHLSNFERLDYDEEFLELTIRRLKKLA
jgi:hypothetical protein